MDRATTTPLTTTTTTTNNTDTATDGGLETTFLEPWDLSAHQQPSSNGNPAYAWDKHALDALPELDPYQDSNEGDAELLDLISAQGPPSRDSLIDSASLDFGGSVGLSDGVSYIGGTFSPRTHPAADDSSLAENVWNQFQLPSSMGLVMPLDHPYASNYTKEPADPTDAVIVDDGELGMRGIYADYHHPHLQQQQHALASFPPLHHPAVPYANARWHEPNPFVQTQFPISPPLEAQSEKEYGTNESQWFVSPERPQPTKLSGEYPRPGPNVPAYGDAASVKLEDVADSRSPSVPDNIPSVFDTYSIGTNDLSIGTEPPVKEDSYETSPQADDTAESSPKVSAFMVSQDASDIVPVSFETENRTLTTSGPLHAPPSVIRRRKQRSSVTSVEQIHNPRPLQIVQEDGLGGAISSEDFVSPPRGARRKGPLSIVGRANAGLRRKNKDTCVQCRLNKRKCDGNAPCDACRPTLHEQPCARACFSNIVEYGTCNYISQRAINHITKSNPDQRVRIEIPSAFDLQRLLSFLGERRGKFNIRASQSWGSLYVLDLGETYKFLKNLSDYNDNSQSTFLEFIDHRIIDSKDKSKNWLSCVKDCDPMNNVYQLLSQWNNMPSRASYSFVSLDGSSEDRMMDVNDPEDRKDILLAAQLSRIFCRMLEVEGFRKLERDFYNIKWKRISLDAHFRFLEELGHILLSLRWRVSWWRRLGDGGQSPDPSQQHYVDRVDHLCQILYVYYTSVLAKLPAWSASDRLKGKWSRYADTENEIWDDFPADTTENGFHQWMAHGQELIEQAGSPHHVSSRIVKA